MTTHTFTRLPLTATKSVPCTVCGKRIRRQRTFEQTLNPFNKKADGTPKKSSDIYRELNERAEKWQAEPETHDKCQPAE